MIEHLESDRLDQAKSGIRELKIACSKAAIGNAGPLAAVSDSFVRLKTCV
jgi:hypothetical protein